MKLSIGNLPQTLTDEQLKALLAPFGNVKSVTIKRDKTTKVSLGFGSAEMDDAAAVKAIAGLNGKEIESKKIVIVNQEDLATKHDETGKQKSSPMNQKSPFGKSAQTGGVTGVQRRGGNRGS